MSDDPHAVAILGRLRDVPGLDVYPEASPTGPGVVPDNAEPPYVVAWINVRYDLGPSLAAASTRAVATVTTHSVGATDTAARVVAGRVRDALLDVTPQMSGRRAFPIRHDTGLPPRPDESTGRLVVDQVDVYRLETLPG